MIQGWFCSNGELWFEVDLITAERSSITVDALLDTGFTDWLAVNNQDAEGLGWRIDREQVMQTGQGEAIFNLYAGTVCLEGEEFNIPVLGGDEIVEVLLGLPWLRTRRLVVDFPLGLLTLGEA